MRSGWQRTEKFTWDDQGYFAIDSESRSGKPIIEGTRVPVDLIVGRLGGMSMEEVAEAYDLTIEDFRAVLEYAATVLAAEEVRPTA